MKWMLIVMVLGTTPVETGMIFDDLDSCYQAEEAMRKEYLRSYLYWQDWAIKNPKESGYPDNDAFMKKRLTFGLCIPHAAR